MCSEAGITMAPAKTCGTLNLDMQTGHMPTRTLSEEEMVTELSARVDAAARRYRGAIMRYLLRPPLSLTLKYAAFMMDLAQQTDHMQEVLARAAERASERSKDSQKGEPSGEFRIDRSGEVSLEVVYAATVNLSPGARLATLLRVYQREERSRMQHALSDLRRLGYAQDSFAGRQLSAGDTALRAYGTALSYEKPVAMLGMLLAFLGVAAENSPMVLRLLTVGSVPKEATRWLSLRAAQDPERARELVGILAREVRDPAQQAAVLEAVEVSGELLAMGAAARPGI